MEWLITETPVTLCLSNWEQLHQKGTQVGPK
jgi:hypothetical protein